MPTITTNPAVVRLRGRNGKFIPVPLSQITRIEGDINYSWVYLTDGTRLVQGKCLKMMQQAVPGFIRIHKSHLVNPQFIHRCMVPRGREGEIIMRSGLTLPVAKRRGKELLETWEGVAA